MNISPATKSMENKKAGVIDRSLTLVITDVLGWKKGHFNLVGDLTFEQWIDFLTSTPPTYLLHFTAVQRNLTLLTQTVSDKLVFWFSWLTIISIQIKQTIEKYTWILYTKYI